MCYHAGHRDLNIYIGTSKPALSLGKRNYIGFVAHEEKKQNSAHKGKTAREATQDIIWGT